jgi:mRNA interferase MazF
MAGRMGSCRPRRTRTQETPMRRGSVYWINLEPAAPPELGKVRPGIIVSNTIQNERLDSVVVVPLSSRAPEIWPLRLHVELRDMKSSYVVIPGIRQVSKTRLHQLIAQTSAALMARIDEALAIYLGD